MDREQINKTSGWKNVIQIIIPYFFIVGVFQLIGALLLGLDIRKLNTPETTVQLFILSFFSLIGTVLTIWLFRKHIANKSSIRLWLEKKYVFKDTILGVLFGFIMLFSGFSILLFSNQIEIKNIHFSPTDFFLSMGVFIFAAFTEELLIRGYILNNLIASFNKYVAVIISAILFSLMHSFNPSFNLFSLLSLFFAGLLFGLSYIFTQSLWFPIALHFGWNFFQGTIFGFNVSGRNCYSVIILSTPNENIWNGGTFGFEGSLLSILFQMIAIVLVYLIFKNRKPNLKLKNLYLTNKPQLSIGGNEI